MADPDLRLHGARSMHDADDPLARCRRIVDRAVPRDRGHCLPRSEQALHGRRQVEAGQLATDDERCPRRVQASLVGAPELRTVERFDGLPGPAGRPVVRRVSRIDRVDERLVGAPSWISPGLEQVVQALVAEPVHLALRERRFEEHLGQDLQVVTRCRREAHEHQAALAAQLAEEVEHESDVAVLRVELRLVEQV